MKKLDINYRVRSVNFDQDGIYTILDHRNFNDFGFFESDADELKSLKENIKKITIPDIEDGDVIYFDKSAIFPKLLLGRLDLSVKRTIKSDKCTKIVISDSLIITDPNEIEEGYIIFIGKDESDYNQVFYISNKHINDCSANNISLELMQRYFPGIWKKVILLPSKISEESIKLMLDSPEKLTYVQNVARYLNSKLQTLDKESAETMLSLFKSGPEEKKLAVNMIASFNISPILFDICDAIGSGQEYFDKLTESSINYKYFKLLLGLNPNSLVYNWNSDYYKRSHLSTLFKSALMSDDQKLKTWNAFKKSVLNDSWVSSNSERLKNYFNQYKMPLDYDKK